MDELEKKTHNLHSCFFQKGSVPLLLLCFGKKNLWTIQRLHQWPPLGYHDFSQWKSPAPWPPSRWPRLPLLRPWPDQSPALGHVLHELLPIQRYQGHVPLQPRLLQLHQLPPLLTRLQKFNTSRTKSKKKMHNLFDLFPKIAVASQNFEASSSHLIPNCNAVFTGLQDCRLCGTTMTGIPYTTRFQD